MGTRDRRGLVLVEVVTLLGVGFMSVGLIVPQIFGAREAARRAQCTNNLKQIGLAMHNYAAVYDSLPMSCVRVTNKDQGHADGHSGFTAMLPFMEQTSVFNAYNFSLENWDSANATAMNVKIATYLCPSNKVGEAVPAADVRTSDVKPYKGTNKFQRGHYGLNWGGVRKASGEDIQKAYGESWRGLMLTVVDPESKKPTTNIKFTDVRDGLSFTVAAAEKRDSFGWGVGGWGGSEFDVNTNSVEPGKGDKERKIFTGSEHPNGMNILMGDGSVRFVTTKLESKTWNALTTRASGEVIAPADLK